jgi:hypothetical protein
VRPAGRLDRLQRTAQRHVLRLRGLATGVSTPATGGAERLVSYVVIETANLWSEYSRAYYLSTAFRARDGHGVRIQLQVGGIRTEEDALTQAILCVKPGLPKRHGPWTPQDEPPWHDRGVLNKIVVNLGASNSRSVSAAAGYGTPATQDLQTVRNYFAHKSQGTAAKMRRLARRYKHPGVRPATLMLSVEPGKRQPVLIEWLDDLYAVIGLTA